MRIFQKGFNFGQDGPGNRLVYHLQGCNMKCIWCSNPEGMNPDGGKEYSIDEELTRKGAILTPLKDLDEMVKWSDIVITASGDEKLCEYIASISQGKLINRADKPEKGNIIAPTSFLIDDIEISIYTNGQSPLMARELRKKIQSIITEEDILEIKIQDHARKILKEKTDSQRLRREYLENILKDEEIKQCLKENKLDEAKGLVENLINSNLSKE